MTFKIAAFDKSDYTDVLIDIISAPKAPYDPNTITTAFMAVVDKGFQTGVFTEEQAEYLIQRVAVETGIIQKMVNIGRTVAAAGGTSANEQLDAALVRGLRRVNALNDGGITGMLADDAEVNGHGFLVLNVDENTTKEDFDAVWSQAGLGEGNSGEVTQQIEAPVNEVKLLEDHSPTKGQA